jgi:DeoR family fructose operon transcriptional repressor
MNLSNSTKNNKIQQRNAVTTYGRRQSLIDTLRKQPGLRVPELARALDVSEGTVRNDLNNSFVRRYQQNAAAKLAIAREAAVLVNDGDSILLDASSTVYYLAKALSERRHLRVMTNGFEVAREMAQNSTNVVILIGGIVNNESSSVTGLLSERIIEELHIQKAFLSCSGFSLERGLTEVLLSEAQIKRKAIESSQQLFALVDSTKFGKEDLTSFARPEKINRLFTDQQLSSEWAERLKAVGVPFTICEEEGVPVK